MAVAVNERQAKSRTFINSVRQKQISIDVAPKRQRLSYTVPGMIVLKLVLMVDTKASTEHLFLEKCPGEKCFRSFTGVPRTKTWPQKNIPITNRVGWDIFREVLFVPALGQNIFL